VTDDNIMRQITKTSSAMHSVTGTFGCDNATSHLMVFCLWEILFCTGPDIQTVSATIPVDRPPLGSTETIHNAQCTTNSIYNQY